MLDPNALSAAIAVVQDQGSRGVMLGTVADTPLSLLVRDTPIIGIDAQASNYDSVIATMVDISRDPAHAATMQDVVQLAAGGVRRSLDFTRNTVMPHLRNLIEQYGVSIQAMGAAPLPYDMDIVYQPEVYKTSVAAAFLERWEAVPAMSAPAPVSLGLYTPEEIFALAKLTDDGGFNTSLEKLLNANEGRGVQAIINVIKGIDSVTSIDDNYALPLALVLANMDTPKEGVQMTYSNYNSTRALLAMLAGKKALNVIARLNHALNVNGIYMPGMLVAGKINLCGEVYKTMLDKGLTAEALIGNELLNRKYRSLQLTDPAVIAELTEVYNRDRGVREQAYLLTKRQRARTVLMNVLREDQKRIAASGEFTVEGDTAEKSWGRLKDFLDKLMTTLWADSEPTTLIAAATCAVWYAHTDASKIIDIMFDIEKSNPGLPSKEVATLATLRYISEWVASQIVVGGNPAEGV